MWIFEDTLAFPQKISLHYYNWSLTYSGKLIKSGALDFYLSNLFISVPSRPRKMLVVINPKSGDSSSVRCYNKTVAPLFKAANIQTHVHG